jgi:hypothetical protein
MKIERKSMKKYILEYLEYVEKNKNKADKKFIEDHLIKINFFQHERLIHLIVTVIYALMDFLAFILGIISKNILPIIIGYMLMCFLVPYIYHYFLLENSVQKMYRQYDEMKKNQ